MHNDDKVILFLIRGDDLFKGFYLNVNVSMHKAYSNLCARI